jgi:uncharacterized protein YjbJ (UPF0337 family)
MNQDIVKGQWKQIAGKVKAKWGELTDDDLRMAEGNAQYLLGKLQEKYGMSKDRAKKELEDVGVI